LDLAQLIVREALGTNEDELCGPWRAQVANGQSAPTQELGTAVFASNRFDALRYPSARSPGHYCYAIFTDRLTPPALVEVYDPHDQVTQRIPANEPS
jgi:hypothetical protein